MQNSPITTLKPAMYTAWTGVMKERGLASNTRRRYQASVIAFFNWLSNPFGGEFFVQHY